MIDTRRIIDVNYFFEQLILLNNHSSQFGCSFSNLKLYQDLRNGLNSTFYFRCSMCNIKLKLNTCKDNININAVQGVMSVGLGFYNSQELFNVLNITYMSDNKYKETHNTVCDA